MLIDIRLAAIVHFSVFKCTRRRPVMNISKNTRNRFWKMNLRDCVNVATMSIVVTNPGSQGRTVSTIAGRSLIPLC